MAEVKDILQEYVATANNPQYKSDWNIINSKFPELKGYDAKLLQEYVATANNPQYKSNFQTINSKFPELFSQQQQAIQPKQTTTNGIGVLKKQLPFKAVTDFQQSIVDLAVPNKNTENNPIIGIGTPMEVVKPKTQTVYRSNTFKEEVPIKTSAYDVANAMSTEQLLTANNDVFKGVVSQANGDTGLDEFNQQSDKNNNIQAFNRESELYNVRVKTLKERAGNLERVLASKYQTPDFMEQVKSQMATVKQKSEQYNAYVQSRSKEVIALQTELEAIVEQGKTGAQPIEVLKPAYDAKKAQLDAIQRDDEQKRGEIEQLQNDFNGKLDDPDFALYSQIYDKINELSGEQQGLISKPEFAEYRKLLDEGDKAQAKKDAMKKAYQSKGTLGKLVDIYAGIGMATNPAAYFLDNGEQVDKTFTGAKIADEGDKLLGRTLKALASVPKMLDISNPIGDENKYDVFDKMFDQAIYASKKRDILNPTATDVQRDIIQKYADVDGYRVMLDENGKPTNDVRDDKFRNINDKTKKEITDKYNENPKAYKTESDFSFSTLITKATPTILDMGTMMATAMLSGGTTGLVAGAGTVGTVSTATTVGVSAAQMYGDMYESGLNAGLTPQEANDFATLTSIMTGMVTLVNPMEANIVKGTASKSIGKFISNSISKADVQLIRSGEMSIGQYAKRMAKEGTKNVFGENAEEIVFEPAVQRATETYYNTKAQKNGQQGFEDLNKPFFDTKQTIETAMITTMASLLMTPIEVANSVPEQRKIALQNALDNPQQFLDIRQKMLEDGDIEKGKFDYEVKAFEEISKQYNTVKPNIKEDLHDDLAELLLKKYTLKNTMSQVNDEVLNKKNQLLLDDINKRLEEVADGTYNKGKEKALSNIANPNTLIDEDKIATYNGAEVTILDDLADGEVVINTNNPEIGEDGIITVEKSSLTDVRNKPKDIEQLQITNAVININGKEYEGKNHAEAILKAQADGQDISQVDRQAEGLFKLSDGTIINREQAKEQFGQDRSELIIPQDEASNQANVEYKRIQDEQENPITPVEPVNAGQELDNGTGIQQVDGNGEQIQQGDGVGQEVPTEKVEEKVDNVEIKKLQEEIDSFDDEYNRLVDAVNKEDRKLNTPKSENEIKLNQLQDKINALIDKRNKLQEQQTPIQQSGEVGSVGVGGDVPTSLRGVKYSDIIVGDKYLEDILSDNKLSEEEKQQVREVFARGVDYFKFDKEGEQKFQQKFANPEDIADIADIIEGVSLAKEAEFNFYNTKNYENVIDAVNYIANNPNEYSPKVVKAVKEIKEKLDNPSSSMNRLYAVDVMKELGITEQSVEEQPKAEKQKKVEQVSVTQKSKQPPISKTETTEQKLKNDKHDRMVGLMREYNSTPTNKKTRKSEIRQSINKLASDLGYTVKGKTGDKIDILNAKGKVIRKINITSDEVTVTPEVIEKTKELAQGWFEWNGNELDYHIDASQLGLTWQEIRRAKADIDAGKTESTNINRVANAINEYGNMESLPLVRGFGGNYERIDVTGEDLFWANKVNETTGLLSDYDNVSESELQSLKELSESDEKEFEQYSDLYGKFTNEDGSINWEEALKYEQANGTTETTANKGAERESGGNDISNSKNSQLEKEKGVNKTQNHQVYYNGKVVDMGYITNPKEQFKYASQRISDNLGTGGNTESVGYVKTPDGKIFEVSRSNKSAKLLSGDKLISAQDKFAPKDADLQSTGKSFTPIDKTAFEKLLDKLKKAFPNVKVELFGKKDFENAKKELQDKGIIVTDTKTKDGTIYGFKTPDGKVFINTDNLNANTPIHEYAHIWQSVFPQEFARGIELLKLSPQGQALIREIQKNPAYKGKTISEIQAEALVTAIGNKGEAIFNSNPTLFNKFKEWLSDFFKKLGDKLGIKDLSADDKLNMFTKKVTGELLGGKALSKNVGENSDIDLQMDKAIKQSINIELVRDKDGNLLAPNGERSNLNETQWKIVRTDAFKNWFGDWMNDPQNASKLVDENGEPLVVYHSTNKKNITEFNVSGKIETFGGLVDNYGSYWTAKNDYIGFKGNEYYSAFLNIRNPFITTDQIFSAIITEDKKSEIDKNGNDGVVLNRRGVTYFDEIIAFEPNQIKLADGTNTTFNPESNDIRFQIANNPSKEEIGKAYDKAQQYLETTDFNFDTDQRDAFIEEIKNNPALKAMFTTSQLEKVYEALPLSVADKVKIKYKLLVYNLKADNSANKAGLKQQQKQMVADITALIKDNLKGITGRQAERLINLATNAVEKNSTVRLGKIINQIANLADQRTYQKAKTLYEIIKARSKRKGGVQSGKLTGVLQDFATINPLDVSDIAKYVELAEKVKQASNVVKQPTDADSDLVYDEVQAYVKAQQDEINSNAINDTLEDDAMTFFTVLDNKTKAKFGDDKTFDDLNEVQQREVFESITKDDIKKYGLTDEERDMVEAFKEIKTEQKRQDFITATYVKIGELKDLLANSVGVITQSPAEKEITDALLNVKLDDMNATEMARVLKLINGITQNNDYSGGGAFVAQQKAVESVAKLNALKSEIGTFRNIKKRLAKIANLSSISESMARGAELGAKLKRAIGFSEFTKAVGIAKNYAHELGEQFAKNKFSKSVFKPINQARLTVYASVIQTKIGEEVNEAKHIQNWKEILESNIKNLRKSGNEDNIKEADVLETAISEIIGDANSFADIAMNLSKTNKELLDVHTFFVNAGAEQKPRLRENANLVHNEEIEEYNDYTKLSFTNIITNSKIDVGDSIFSGGATGIVKKKSKSLMDRSNYNNLKDTMKMDLNWINNQFKALASNEYDIQTSKPIETLKAIFNADNEKVREILGTDNFTLLRDRLIRMTNKKIHESTIIDDLMSVLGRSGRTLALGNATPIGMVASALKQSVVLASTIINNIGKNQIPLDFSIFSRDKRKQENILKLLAQSDIISRRASGAGGFYDTGKIENKISDNIAQKGLKILGEGQKAVSDFSMMALRYTDIKAADISWITYYKNYLRKKGLLFDDNNEFKNPNKDAMVYAETMVERSQGANTDVSQADMWEYSKGLSSIFMPFMAFAVQANVRMFNNYHNIYNGKNRGEALKDIAAFNAEIALFNVVKLGISASIVNGLIPLLKSAIIGGDDDDEVEKARKAKQLREGFWQQLAQDHYGIMPLFDDNVTKPIANKLWKNRTGSDVPLIPLYNGDKSMKDGMQLGLFQGAINKYYDISKDLDIMYNNPVFGGFDGMEKEVTEYEYKGNTYKIVHSGGYVSKDMYISNRQEGRFKNIEVPLDVLVDFVNNPSEFKKVKTLAWESASVDKKFKLELDDNQKAFAAFIFAVDALSLMGASDNLLNRTNNAMRKELTKKTIKKNVYE